MKNSFKMGMLATILAASSGGYERILPEKPVKVDQSFLRKKCKSCKQFNVSRCKIHKYKGNPMG